MQRVVDTAGEVLLLAGEVRGRIPTAPPATAADLGEQYAGLVFRGFVAATPARWWPRLPTYLRAMLRRIEAAAANPRREAESLAAIGDAEDAYAELCDRQPPGPLPAAVAEVGWLLEEYRVGLFAQALGTAVPVSAKRIRTALDAAARTG
jgi:ATP-dependent helicase HrpA